MDKELLQLVREVVEIWEEECKDGNEVDEEWVIPESLCDALDALKESVDSIEEIESGEEEDDEEY